MFVSDVCEYEYVEPPDPNAPKPQLEYIDVRMYPRVVRMNYEPFLVLYLAKAPMFVAFGKYNSKGKFITELTDSDKEFARKSGYKTKYDPKFTYIIDSLNITDLPDFPM